MVNPSGISDPAMDFRLAEEEAALRLLIEDRPDQARVMVNAMSGKNRAIFAFYIRELGYMIEEADADARSAGR